MSEIKLEEIKDCESQNNEIQNSLSTIPTINTTTQSSSEMSYNDMSKDTLLKTLLSTSTALSSTVSTSLSTAKISTTIPIESMITKEVNDTQLNLKKILYEPEKEPTKDKESYVHNVSQRTLSDIQTVDDDDRLVIDISDDEIDGQKKKKIKPKSMPILEYDNRESKNAMTNRMQNSITYSFETSGVSSSCVKIDILPSSGTFFNSDAEMSKQSTPTRKYLNISLNDELNILSHEIDKQMNKKTNEILELIKEYLESSLNEMEFHSKMNDISNVSTSDLSTIAKKLIKRYKFEPNPNQKDFMRIKFLQFPTSSADLINYFKNLIPSMNKDKFVNMIKFYEIIIKEMFNLNKTKTLQYLLDFMIKRKNAQLDLLSYNYETNNSPNFKQKVSSSTFETPDSTQGIRIEGKINKLNDTSYNFVIRSDPIYLTAGSTFMTNHRDVIKCRSTPCVQTHNFERRPFDNNILKGRRIGRRIMNDTIESEKTQILGEYNNQCSFQKAENKTQINSISALPTLTERVCSIEEKPLKIMNEMTPISKSTEVGCCPSPILVESDTPSSSPPIHKIIKPQVIPQRNLQRTFSERAPQTTVKEHKAVFEFKKSNDDSSKLMETTTNFHQSTEQQASSTSLNFREKCHDPLINGQLSLNEIKTLSLNGTEIIPAPMLRNTITSRRKTIDVDHAQPMKNPLELKKVQALPIQVMKSPSLIPTSKCNFIHDQSQQNKQAASKILKRRQSCHERIFTSKNTNASNIGKNFIEFMNGEYESNKMETEIKRLQNLSFDEGKELQFHHKQQNIQKSTPPLYAQQKRVKFNSEIPAHSQRSPQGARTQHTPAPQKQQSIENNSPRAIFRQSIQQTLMQPTLKFNQSPIDYQRYQLYFERELRERGFVDRVETLQDKDSKAVPPNRPLELVSHVPPERYLQSSESSQSSVFSSPKLTRTFERSPRIHQRTPVMTNDEKATLVAFNQLQSLHRDPSNLTAQQYSEHLKQVHHLKQIQKSALNSPQGIYQEHQNQLLDERENSCKNTQQSTYQQEDLSSSRLYTLQDGSNDNEQQSLQRKLKLKSKSTKYVEPSQLSKIYQSTPRSTYYTDPYTMTTHKKPSTPTVYSHSQERSIEQHSQEQLSAFYSLRNESSVNPQIQYQWMLAQAQQQQQQQHQHHQNLLNHNQPARPIPRPAIPSPFNDLNLAGIPPNHNIFSHNSLQAFPSQQSDFYRHYFPKSF